MRFDATLELARIIHRSKSGNLVQALSLFMLAFFVNCKKGTFAVALLVLQGVAGACVVPGVITSSLSIAPSLAGTIISLVLFFGKIGSAISPNVGTLQEWSKIFASSALLLIFSALFFLIFASAEQQSWSFEKITTLDEEFDDKAVDTANKPRSS
uniref:MFS domain-containing protein n=1 Tax=Loa loa TaxID=7209 RepID=A0A1I7VPR3_LOALO